MKMALKLRWIWAACLAAGLGIGLWASDWASTSGNPQRDGWSQGETKLSKAAIANGQVKLLYKIHFDNQPAGLQALTAPIDLSNIIGYQGFRELLFIGGSGNAVYSLDSVVGQPYFHTAFEAQASAANDPATVACPGGLTANVAMSGNSGVARGFFAPPPPPAARRGAAAAARGAAGRGAARRGGGRFGRAPAVLWAVSSDGYLRTLRQEDGNATWIAPTPFVPAGSRVSGLNVNDNVIYAATINDCGGHPNGLFAAQFTPPVLATMPGQPFVKAPSFAIAAFLTNGSGFSGSGGTAIGSDGTVYGQVASGHGDVAGAYHDSVLALDPQTLLVTDYFTPEGAEPSLEPGVTPSGVTPAYFDWNGKRLLVAADSAGHLYLLDAAQLGGANHHTPLYRSPQVVNPSAGVWGAFATAQQGDARWVYAAIHGPAVMKFPVENGATPQGAIVAFKIESHNGHPELAPQWISPGMISPAAPITANGLVFALSTGVTPRIGKSTTVAEVEKSARPATLYMLDAASGKPLLTSGNTATTFATTGIAVANGRVYFTTHDDNLYAYGIPTIR